VFSGNHELLDKQLTETFSIITVLDPGKMSVCVKEGLTLPYSYADCGKNPDVDGTEKKWF
jgi:hypothetical protein